jgi:hypothetical protein
MALDRNRLDAALSTLVRRLLDRRAAPDHWDGRLANSALSTATALHALSALHVPLAGLRDPCLDFVDSLWTNRGGFFGTWADDAVDCEYTFYALLALGHLSLDPS